MSNNYQNLSPKNIFDYNLSVLYVITLIWYLAYNITLSVMFLARVTCQMFGCV